MLTVQMERILAPCLNFGLFNCREELSLLLRKNRDPSLFGFERRASSCGSTDIVNLLYLRPFAFGCQSIANGNSGHAAWSVLNAVRRCYALVFGVRHDGECVGWQDSATYSKPFKKYKKQIPMNEYCNIEKDCVEVWQVYYRAYLPCHPFSCLLLFP